MKTLKLALVATVVTLLMVQVADADGFKSRPPKFIKHVNISLETAIQDPVLVAAMYEQLNESDVLKFPLPPITVQINYKGSLYSITGSTAEWIRFFRMEGEPPVHSKIKLAIDE